MQLLYMYICSIFDTLILYFICYYCEDDVNLVQVKTKSNFCSVLFCSINNEDRYKVLPTSEDSAKCETISIKHPANTTVNSTLFIVARC